MRIHSLIRQRDTKKLVRMNMQAEGTGNSGKVATALVCPERWSNSQRRRWVYDAIVSFEKIAQFLDGRREKLERESGKESIEIAKRLSWKARLTTH